MAGTAAARQGIVQIDLISAIPKHICSQKSPEKLLREQFSFAFSFDAKGSEYIYCVLVLILPSFYNIYHRPPF